MTPESLDTFRAKYAENDNEWWYLSSGDMQNLFEEACDRLDALQAEVDRLRAQVAAVEGVLEEGDHGLYCDSHYGNQCTCWNHKIAIITGYGYE